MSRFKVSYKDQPISQHPSKWEATEAGVAYMREHRVSPVAIQDSEKKSEFGATLIRIEAYEGSPEVVAARAVLAAANRAPGACG